MSYIPVPREKNLLIRSQPPSLTTDPSHRLYSNFHFLFKNLRVKTLAFQT